MQCEAGRGVGLGKLADDLAALAAGLCSGADREKCAAEFGDNLEWTCTNCEKKRAADLSPYTIKLLRLRNLRQAGYPLQANDLTLEEWLDLGDLENALPSSESSLLAGMMQLLTARM